MPRAADEPMHTVCRLRDPKRWVLLLTDAQPKRLVVFVHGFRGKALSSWKEFPKAGGSHDWWRESDMLFVGYKSTGEPLTTVADRLRARLTEFYPTLPDEYLRTPDCRLRDPAEEPYKELILVGHSLGGVIVRRTLMHLAWEWTKLREEDGSAPPSPLLAAKQRLFSPASGGIRTAGWLALLKGFEKWRVAEVLLSTAPAYQELKPESRLLEGTKDLTQRLHQEHQAELGALAASIAWAQNEKVVQAEFYESDAYSDTIEHTSHRTVCKPNSDRQSPLLFVETGRVR